MFEYLKKYVVNSPKEKNIEKFLKYELLNDSI
jgi:hypothetical protein